MVYYFLLLMQDVWITNCTNPKKKRFSE